MLEPGALSLEPRARAVVVTWTLADAIASGRGTERSFNCPVHDDSRASASVNVAKGVWTCYACGAKGKVDGMDAPDASAILASMRAEKPAREYPEAWLDLFDAAGPSPYWASRFGHDIAAKFRCGTHPLNGAPTYPIRNDSGRVVGVVVRSEGVPKYLYPPGVSTSRTLFGQLRPAPVVVLVEGAADAMALEAHGASGMGWTVLGCYGAGLHAPQVDLVAMLAPRLVVLAFDDDDAGRSAALRSEALLGSMAPCMSVQWGRIGGTDPADVDGNPVTALDGWIRDYWKERKAVA